MLDILEYLTKEFKSVCPRVYEGNAKDEAIFPYIVFSLPNSNAPDDDNNVESVTLEIDIWDYSQDSYDATKNVEILANRIEELLKYNRELGDDYLLIFSKRNRFKLNDPDNNMKRRQLRYNIKYYNK